MTKASGKADKATPPAPAELRPILQHDSKEGFKVLHSPATEVPIKDITGKKIQGILADMKAALAAELDGVGIAAPQLGFALRIFTISDIALRKTQSVQTVYINPEIVRASKEKEDLEEGCLSVRPLYGTVRRSTKVTVRAYDERGERFERGGSGLLAQIFQHEIDHLNGILFIDKAKNIHEMPEEEQESIKNNPSFKHAQKTKENKSEKHHA